MGLGAATLALAVLGVLAWVSYLVNQNRRREPERAPQNTSPYMTDDELESGRLNKTLIAALAATAVMAIVMPIYYLNESGRQVDAGHRFDEIAVERGEHLYEEFQCLNCHGADGGGGGAAFVEARSGLDTTWTAPSINDIFYRYSKDEARFWIVFGRQGTPMPAWGVDGGGPLNSQQVDELLDYLEYIEVDQMEAVSQVEGRVGLEQRRLDNADQTMLDAIARQQGRMAALQNAPGAYDAVKTVPDDLVTLLTGSETCSDESAALLGTTCRGSTTDSDRDGLGDAVEIGLADLVAAMLADAPPSKATRRLEEIAFDPAAGFSSSFAGALVPDLEAAQVVIDEFEAIARDLRLTVENQDLLLASGETALEFLMDAAEARRWSVDFGQVATDGFDGSISQASRAAGLYNAFCARCHTAGYSAGVPFTQEPGSGALGPSLREGRSVVQFPDEADHLEFLVKGSENGVQYGLNGIGRGWMPGFGTVLSEADLMLIVKYERVMP